MSTATAAIAKHADPELTDLQAVRLLAGLRQRLDALHGRVRVMHQAPIKAFDYRHQEFVRNFAGKPPREQHAVLTEAVAYFEKMAADPTAWPGTKFAEDQATTLAAAQAGGQQLRSMGLAFNARAFLTTLRSRGLAVALGADGRIAIAPASMLNPTDRDQLRSHRVEIVAALADIEVF
jgi:hypothetical protein